MQAYHWAALYPAMVERAIVVCGSARTAVHNSVFLSGLLRTLEAAPEHCGSGRFSAEPTAALHAFGHIYAGWGLSQDFLPRRPPSHRARRARPRHLPAGELGGALRAAAAPPTSTRRRSPGRTATSPTTPLYGGDLPRALAAIRAKVLLHAERDGPVLPRGRQRGRAAASGAGAELRPIPSIWGHRAGNPNADATDATFLKRAVAEWMAR